MRDDEASYLSTFSTLHEARSVVPEEQPLNQQCAEACMLSLSSLWSLKLFLNVDWPEVHLFVDNSAAGFMPFRFKATVGQVFQQPLLQRLLYFLPGCLLIVVHPHLGVGVANCADPVSRLWSIGDGDRMLVVCRWRAGASAVAVVVGQAGG